jgi:hypothetical protein
MLVTNSNFHTQIHTHVHTQLGRQPDASRRLRSTRPVFGFTREQRSDWSNDRGALSPHSVLSGQSTVKCWSPTVTFTLRFTNTFTLSSHATFGSFGLQMTSAAPTGVATGFPPAYSHAFNRADATAGARGRRGRIAFRHSRIEPRGCMSARLCLSYWKIWW